MVSKESIRGKIFEWAPRSACIRDKERVKY